MRIVLPLLLCLALPGCLTTPRPVFDATNSVAAADSTSFSRVAHRWEVRLCDGHAPGEIIAGGARVVEQEGARVMIAPMAQMFLIGTEIDYRTSLLESGFVFNNPNVSEACGCGESIKFRDADAQA